MVLIRSEKNMEEAFHNESDSSELESQGQVKRPMNAFMLWSKEKRRKISSVDPSLHNSHISKILGEEWKNLPNKEKDPYIKESKSLMDKHKKEHPNYHYKPRQNKLTKALKELSSLHSTLSTPPGFTSKIRSLTNTSAFVNASGTAHYSPYMAYPRSKVYKRHAVDSRCYFDIPEHYAQPTLCRGCTCNMDCVDMSLIARQRYISQQRYFANYGNHRSSPATYIDKSSHNLNTWKWCTASSRCGWSVPTLVEDVADRREEGSEYRKDDRFEDTAQEISEKSYTDDESKDVSTIADSS